MSDRLELLSVAEMAACDAATIRAGTKGERLMLNAGAAVAGEVLKRFKPCAVTVLCGSGNNGGDGFVVARLLAQRRFRVRVALLGERKSLKGDAAIHAAKWKGKVEPLTPASIAGAKLVVDAVFGSGLSRPIDASLGKIFAALNVGKIPVVAVDVPSGVHGDSGEAMGIVPQAVLTVTFCRKKPGHLLMPGRVLCGETVLADIGIKDGTVAEIAPKTFENAPELWHALFPQPEPGDHKYSRGGAVVVGGAAMTGAARLAARAAARIGAGIVTIASPPERVEHYLAAFAACTVRAISGIAPFEALLTEKRAGAVLVGPGNDVNLETRAFALAALKAAKPTVLDGGALSVFEGALPLLAHAAHSQTVLTPHEGEFKRVFGAIEGDHLVRAREAARRSGAVVLFKGFDTVIAHPDGRAAINANAPAWLATAGAGDVLAGFITGLLAQGMPAFEAACAAAWLHGECAQAFGPGLVADDLAEQLPQVLRRLVIG